jgi:hypothetical protein
MILQSVSTHKLTSSDKRGPCVIKAGSKLPKYYAWNSYTSCVARSGNLICVQIGQSAYIVLKRLYADWPLLDTNEISRRCVTAPFEGENIM